MTLLQRAVLHQGHPRRIIVGLITLLWTTYLLWLHELELAILAVGVGVLIGIAVTADMREEPFAQTTLGRILMIHLHPMNIAMQLCGIALLIWSVWHHSVIHLLLAVSLILVGHMWGWHRVNASL